MIEHVHEVDNSGHITPLAQVNLQSPSVGSLAYKARPRILPTDHASPAHAFDLLWPGFVSFFFLLAFM